MARQLRQAPGGVLFHALNRGVGRNQIFFSPQDYAAFEVLMAQTKERVPMRICSYCLMPNHWHLALWPELDDQAATIHEIPDIDSRPTLAEELGTCRHRAFISRAVQILSD